LGIVNLETPANGIPFIRWLCCTTSPKLGRKPLIVNRGDAHAQRFLCSGRHRYSDCPGGNGRSDLSIIRCRGQQCRGLGMLALGWSSPDALRAEIRATKALTRRP
jgi:hypothetical protein